MQFSLVGINTNWLLTGEGSMLLAKLPAPAGEILKVAELPAPHRVDELQSGFLALPMYSQVIASAGHGAVNVDEKADDALMFKEDWIRHELGASPQNLFLIRVSGDSMEPTLRAGDVILIDRSTSRPDREGIYIIRVGEMLLVKRLQALPDGSISVTSDNSAFKSWNIEADAQSEYVQIYGRVVWAGRRL